MNVDAEFGAWLRSACLVAVASSSALATAWGELAATMDSISPLANKADAEAEASRQLALFGVPMAIDILQVDGLRVDLVGKPVTLTAARAGYSAGVAVFVLGARELDGVERTNLIVLRKLA